MVHCVFLCIDENATTLTTQTMNATTSANCLPRWIVYPNSYSIRSFDRHFGLTSYHRRMLRWSTLQRCLDACVAASWCVDAEWTGRFYGAHNLRQCTMHYFRAPRLKGSFSTMFRPIRQCEDMLTSGIVA